MCRIAVLATESLEHMKNNVVLILQSVLLFGSADFLRAVLIIPSSPLRFHKVRSRTLYPAT